MRDPYQTCPSFSSDHFFFRQVAEEDAADLLACYADPQAAPIFNSDNCTSNFIYTQINEMKNCIRFWLEDYRRKGYVRLSLLDQGAQKAFGTIEFFAWPKPFPGYGTVGLLRLDLASHYENQTIIDEILHALEKHLFPLFSVEGILTKAVPEAAERVQALHNAGFQAVPPKSILPYDHYYLLVKPE